MIEGLSRRDLLSSAVAAAGIGAFASPTMSVAKDQSSDEPFGYCFNTSTIRGQQLPFSKKLEIIARAGFRAIEPWLDEIDKHLKEGGTARDLRKQLDDLGLTIESAIGFHAWVVDDDAKRAAALEQAKRDMELLALLGAKRLAAPPVGATDNANLDLRKAAERYRMLLELGVSVGVVPQVELWGFSKSLSRLGDVAYVAIESGHPDACMLLDVYHLYKGGSDLNGLKCVAGGAMHVMHLNDYPSIPPRAEITDAARTYPGDGVAPLKTIFRTLRDNGYRGYLSLELFNRDLWREDPLLVCRTGLEKMQAAVRAAFA